MAKGGKRAGSGRKAKEVKIARRNFADAVLSDPDEQAKWKEMLKANRTFYDSKGNSHTEPDNRIRLDALKFIAEHKHGKAPQTLEHTNKGGEGFKVLVEHIGSGFTHSAPAASE